jgi:hypothetical protein
MEYSLLPKGYQLFTIKFLYYDSYDAGVPDSSDTKLLKSRWSLNLSIQVIYFKKTTESGRKT